jgi:hypothetical protein
MGRIVISLRDIYGWVCYGCIGSGVFIFTSNKRDTDLICKFACLAISLPVVLKPSSRHESKTVAQAVTSISKPPRPL